MKHSLIVLLLSVSLQTFGQTTLPAGTPIDPASPTTAVTSSVISLAAFEAKKIRVTSASYKDGIWTFNGYHTSVANKGKFETNPVVFPDRNAFAVSSLQLFSTVSLVTIPLKVRSQKDTFPQNAQLGLTNAGLVYNVANWKMTRYFSTGKQSIHQVAVGLMIAPSVEELSPETTENFVNKKSKELFISTGLAITYSYNDVTIALVPFGVDLATSPNGKHYIYNKQSWWGAGIGITAKIFGWSGVNL